VSVQQRALALVGFTELEALQERILSEFADLCAAQSGALWISGEKGVLRLRAWRGLLDRRVLPEVVEPSLVQNRAWKSGASLLVPLLTQNGELTGLVQLNDPIPGVFDSSLLTACEALGPFAATAMRTAIRFAHFQRQGLRDRETGAYSLSYFTDYAAKEIYKARRYGRSFSLLTFSIDNYLSMKQRLGPGAVRQAQQVVLKAMSLLARDADVVARASEQEFHVLLPETDSFGGAMFLRRALALVLEQPEAIALEARVPLGLTGGLATFPRDGDEFPDLLACCTRRMSERRGSLHHHLHLGPLSFWDEVELLLGNARSPKLPEAPGEPSRRGKVASVLFEELQHEVGRELLREPLARGLVYLGVKSIRADLPMVRALDDAPADFGPRVYLLGRHGDFETHRAMTPVFLEGDAQLARHEFILWMGDGAAYALLQRPGKGATWGFHTADTTLVEGLISKLQTTYDLQPY
jgi:two-component system cell cycle response regulator